MHKINCKHQTLGVAEINIQITNPQPITSFMLDAPPLRSPPHQINTQEGQKPT